HCRLAPHSLRIGECGLTWRPAEDRRGITKERGGPSSREVATTQELQAHVAFPAPSRSRQFRHPVTGTNGWRRRCRIPDAPCCRTRVARGAWHGRSPSPPKESDLAAWTRAPLRLAPATHPAGCPPPQR